MLARIARLFGGVGISATVAEEKERASEVAGMRSEADVRCKYESMGKRKEERKRREETVFYGCSLPRNTTGSEIRSRAVTRPRTPPYRCVISLSTTSFLSSLSDRSACAGSCLEGRIRPLVFYCSVSVFRRWMPLLFLSPPGQSVRHGGQGTRLVF